MTSPHVMNNNPNNSERIYAKPCAYTYPRIMRTPYLHRYATDTVGCIYASNPRYKFNILQNLFKSFKLLLKHSRLLKNIFLYFSVFLLKLVQAFYHFSCPTYSTKVCILLLPRGLIPSREALTGLLAQPDKLAVHQLRR